MKSSQTKDFGFDFFSVYEEKIGAASYAECKANISDKCSPNIEEVSSADEIVEALRNALNEILSTIPDAEEDDDGLTAAEVIASCHNRKQKPRGISIPRNKVALREQEDAFSVERILDLTLECAELVVSRGIIWGADLYSKIWRPLQTETQMANFLHGLGVKYYGNSVKWFGQRVSGDPAFRTPDFFETTNLFGKVSVADGILDVRTNTFSERTLSDCVAATLRWSHNEIACPPKLERFKEAMYSLAVTENCYLRLQELCGVALHAEPAGRILFFQHWDPRVASAFTKLLSKAWDDDFVTFLGLRDHEKSFRTAQALERPIIISAKEGDSTLRDISTVLALVDGDGVNVDRKHVDPFDFVSRCTLICAGRNLPSLQKASARSLNYFLVRVNLGGDLPENTSIHEILGYTREFVAWSLDGLRRYISNHCRFTYHADSDIQREDTSIIDFVKDVIVGDPCGKIPTSALQEAYDRYCARNNLTILPKTRLLSYLRDTFLIESRTIRVSWYNEGQPSFGYVGIRFTEEYQALLSDLTADSPDSDEWQHISDEDEDELNASEIDDDRRADFEPGSELIYITE